MDGSAMKYSWIFVIGLLLSCCQISEAKSSAGRKFAVSFAAGRSDSTSGDCRIYIHAKDTTNAEVRVLGLTTYYTIQAGSFVNHTVSPTLRLTEGIENKAIYVDADNDVTVMLDNARTDDVMETMLALPIETGENKYPIISYPTIDEDVCDASTTASFYAVMPYEDDTTVSIYMPDTVNGGHVLVTEVTLNINDVYSNRTLTGTYQGYDFTGFYVEANKPVSVTAGNSCADLVGTSLTYHYANPIWSSMPTWNDAGQDYITYTPYYDGVTGEDYIVRVLALSDNTFVTFSDSSTLLDTGEFYTKEFTDNSKAEVIECSKPCIAAEYSVNILDYNGIFMVVLPPVDDFVSDILFTKPFTYATMDEVLTILFKTDNPATSEIFLNNNDISQEAWQEVTTGYYILNIPMPTPAEQPHRLMSSDPAQPISLLVQGHYLYGDGYGFIASTGNVTGSSNSTRKEPLYRIKMNGEFRSSTGEDFTAECQIQYSREMNDEAVLRIPEVNALIGSTLCPQQTVDQLEVVSVSTPFITDGNRGITELQYILAVDLNVLSLNDVETCAQEIDDHLVDHNNWKDPLLPALPGCPEVIFNSRQFNDSGNEWICSTYELTHTGAFSTDDSSDITIECLLTYSDSLTLSTYNQMQKVNDLILDGTLCTSGGVLISSSPSSVTALGDQGQSLQNYIFDLANTSPEGKGNLYSCVNEISSYMALHENWQQPIIDVPVGSPCPAVVFDPQEFTEDRQKWICG